jgi:hypothetical protein
MGVFVGVTVHVGVMVPVWDTVHVGVTVDVRVAVAAGSGDDGLAFDLQPDAAAADNIRTHMMNFFIKPPI